MKLMLAFLWRSALITEQATGASEIISIWDMGCPNGAKLVGALLVEGSDCSCSFCFLACFNNARAPRLGLFLKQIMAKTPALNPLLGRRLG